MSKFSKTDIINNISSNDQLKSLLEVYKTPKTTGTVHTFENTWNNGLAGSVYEIKIDGKLSTVIVPVFSTEKTVTWNFSYLKDVRMCIKDAPTEDHDLVNLILVPMFFMDKETGEMTFLGATKLSTWLEKGNKGKNGYSVYWWNDDLPNYSCLNKKQLKTDLLVSTLPSMSDKELKEFCKDFAIANAKKFGNTAGRSEKTIISNIAKGVYAEIKVYTQLLAEGHNVELEWTDKDDLGIDIIYNVGNHSINIDVKSTSDEFLKVRAYRQETDYYCIAKWNGAKLSIVGFLNKWLFWKNKFVETKAPEKDDKSGLYKKKLTKVLLKEALSIGEIEKDFASWKKKALASKATLFEVA